MDFLDKLEKKMKGRKSGDKTQDKDLDGVSNDDYDKLVEEYLDFDFEDYAKEHHLDSLEDIHKDALKYNL